MGDLAFSPEEAEELSAWLKGGGTLIVDSCGGRKEFAEMIQQDLQKMLAVIDEPKLLSPDDRALTSAGGIPTAFVRENKNRALRGPEAREILGHFDHEIRISSIFRRYKSY